MERTNRAFLALSVQMSETYVQQIDVLKAQVQDLRNQNAALRNIASAEMGAKLAAERALVNQQRVFDRERHAWNMFFLQTDHIFGLLQSNLMTREEALDYYARAVARLDQAQL